MHWNVQSVYPIRVRLRIEYLQYIRINTKFIIISFEKKIHHLLVEQRLRIKGYLRSADSFAILIKAFHSASGCKRNGSCKSSSRKCCKQHHQ